jgi:glycosyltransferase involved in cell wall biosynthesis
MNVAYDYQIFNHQRYGGISRYFCELAQRIDCFPGTKARVVAGWHVNEYLQQFNPELTIGYRRSQVRGLDRLINGISKRCNSVWSDAYLHQHPTDIVHYTFYYPTAQSHGAMRVLTVYDMIHERFRESVPPREKHLISAKAAAVKQADWIVCPSENTKRDLQEFCDVDPCKITVILHGYEMMTEIVQVPSAEWLDRPYILYVGDRGWYKNFDRLLQAYANNFSQDFRLVCFGSTPFNSMEQQRITKLGLNFQQVCWTSGSDAKLRGMYQQADIFVYPSLYEGFGYPPLEAMSLDCPVACSQVSCFPETVANAAELFDPQDVDSIGAALCRVLASPKRQAELVALGRQRLQHFSWQSCAAAHHQLYQSLC